MDPREVARQPDVGGELVYFPVERELVCIRTDERNQRYPIPARGDGAGARIDRASKVNTVGKRVVREAAVNGRLKIVANAPAIDPWPCA